MRSGSLTIVGTGIQLGQMTLEARACLETAEKVFFLVADPVTVHWLLQVHPRAESLDSHYHRDKDRLTSYREMVERILEAVRDGLDVCVAFYGHPGVFVYPSHEALRQARQEGYPARMLPGVSAQDCLFSDLNIDPATTGCQSFEATDFLVYQRRFDPASALVLWQVGVIGRGSYQTRCNRRGFRVLAATLLQHYEPSHEAVLYEAARYPFCDPRIERVPLAQLPNAGLTLGSTLYVPPRACASANPEMISRLGIPRKRRT